MFDWTAEKPDPQMLFDVLAIDGVTWTGNVNRPGRDGIRSSDSDHNRELRAWLRKLVKERLVTLHHSHPFTTVTLLNDRGRTRLTSAHTPSIPA